MRKKNSVDIQRIRLHLQLTAITYDTNRGIPLIDYDLLGNPTRVQFCNGNVTEYVYSATGARLQTTHRTAVSGISVQAGKTKTLTSKETLSSDITYYMGNFVYTKDGLQYHFADGYNDGTSTGYHYYIRDHQGNNRVVAKYDGTIEQTTHYYPYGGILSQSTNQGFQKYKYNGKEFDTMHGLNMYDYGARQQDPTVGMFTSMDPLCEKYYNVNPYMYCAGNPIRYVDPDGREPIKKYAGTSTDFKNLLNNSPRHVGKFKGQAAINYLKSLSGTEWKWSQCRPIPIQTGYFNMKKGRYIYTTKGGWLDMAHFMFYAGKAYNYKIQKEQAKRLLNDKFISSTYLVELYKIANMDPVAEAVQDGYLQEFSDKYVAPHSAYSYEDLPTDKIGAIFGAEYFDPNSSLPFAEQLFNYLQTLGAVSPKEAPNFNQLPLEDSDSPTQTNMTTTPLYTNDDNKK